MVLFGELAKLAIPSVPQVAHLELTDCCDRWWCKLFVGSDEKDATLMTAVATGQLLYINYAKYATQSTPGDTHIAQIKIIQVWFTDWGLVDNPFGE